MIALITGASSGFGAAISRRLIKDGHFVIGLARREEKLKKLQSELGKNFFPLTLDVTDTKSIQSLYSQLPDHFKDIDVLINNAGLALGLSPAQNSDLQDWKTMVDTNIQGVLNCTNVILPKLVAKNHGHVINLGSIAAEYPYPGGNVYGATKAFVRQFALNLRADLLGTAIRVTDIEPGLCGGTEFSEVRFKGDRERVENLYKGTKPITGEDIAETVSWILNLPAHVNINTISMMPVCQAFGPLSVHRAN